MLRDKFINQAISTKQIKEVELENEVIMNIII